MTGPKAMRGKSGSRADGRGEAKGCERRSRARVQWGTILYHPLGASYFCTRPLPSPRSPALPFVPCSLGARPPVSWQMRSQRHGPIPPAPASLASPSHAPHRSVGGHIHPPSHARLASPPSSSLLTFPLPLQAQTVRLRDPSPHIAPLPSQAPPSSPCCPSPRLESRPGLHVRPLPSPLVPPLPSPPKPPHLRAGGCAAWCRSC